MPGTIDLTDPQQLSAFVTALKKAGLGGGSSGGSSSPAPQSSFGNPSFGNFNKATESATKETGNFVKSVLEADTSLASYTKKMGNIIPMFQGVINSTASTIHFLENMNGTFQNMSKVGAGFNGDLGALAAGAGAARMSIGAFATLIGNNSQNLTTLGGSVNQGAKRFAELSRAMFEDGAVIQGMTNLGYSLEESNELLMDNAAMLGRQARLRGMSDQDVTASYIEYGEKHCYDGRNQRRKC